MSSSVLCSISQQFVVLHFYTFQEKILLRYIQLLHLLSLLYDLRHKVNTERSVM